ncbi:Flp pilus assembly protein TadG [Rhizobium mongolense subsp. loessense]|uniref:Flp pilus assembly protein TadG n=1 Tax=Rhizobium mongolense subsp. loessense TaxID=158890 RepID=A0A1G4U5K3_9HYPH|nr:TadE/TadG family type IV pilus assembly protein [Rhizobium mongolense]SCW88904.1 Flp pilus assembly protein TadG [Rhizobium mongolense subsp. loessense]
MSILRRFTGDQKGAAAVEFAILALPFFLVIFAIIEIAIMCFVAAGLDAALHKTARQVRVGTAATDHWDLNIFKATLCGNLVYYFDCSNSLLVRATVITDMNSVNKISGIADGTLSVSEDFNIGSAGDYVLIQAFLPWIPVVQYYSYSSSKLDDGRYVLGSAELFKNEPF